MKKTLYALLALGAVILTFAGLAFAGIFTPPRPVKQPMAFSHKLHVEEEDMECTDCHRYAKKLPHSTLPVTKECMECHFEAEGKHPDEPRIREYARKNQEIEWIQVNRLPGHVYFSHRMHVAVAKMECKECHRGVAQMKEPLVLSDITYLTMKRCMDCHYKRGIRNDCVTCHK